VKLVILETSKRDCRADLLVSLEMYVKLEVSRCGHEEMHPMKWVGSAQLLPERPQVWGYICTPCSTPLRSSQSQSGELTSGFGFGRDMKHRQHVSWCVFNSSLDVVMHIVCLLISLILFRTPCCLNKPGTVGILCSMNTRKNCSDNTNTRRDDYPLH